MVPMPRRRSSLVVLDPAMDTSTPSGRLVANVFCPRGRNGSAT